MCSFVSGCFHLACCFQDTSTWKCVSLLPFLWQNNIPLGGLIHLSTDTWVVSPFRLRGIVLLITRVWKCLFASLPSVLLVMYLGLELLDYKVVPCFFEAFNWCFLIRLKGHGQTGNTMLGNFQQVLSSNHCPASLPANHMHFTCCPNCFCLYVLSHVWLCDPMDCSLPGTCVHGILQARILEWVAVSSSRGSPWPRDWNWVSCIAGRFFTILSF